MRWLFLLLLGISFHTTTFTQYSTPFNCHVLLYQNISPKTSEVFRDRSLLVNGQLPPSSRRIEKVISDEQRVLQKFDSIKIALEQQLDSLISAHFPMDIFLYHFQLETTIANYQNFTLKNAPLTVDTTLTEISKHYVYQAIDSNIKFPIYIRANLHQGAFFANIDFGDQYFTAEELNFLPPTEIAAYAQQQFPNVNFVDFGKKMPVAALVYLPCKPQDTHPSYPQMLIPVPDPCRQPKSSSPKCTGLFAYQLQALLPEQGHYAGQANYYFSVHKLQLYVKTINYYDLLDE